MRPYRDRLRHRAAGQRADKNRFDAAPRNAYTFLVRNAGSSLPERSWRIIVKPPEVPLPGIAGGGNEKANPAPMLDSFCRMLACIGSICSDRDLRRSQGLSVTKKKAVFVLSVRVRRL